MTNNRCEAKIDGKFKRKTERCYSTMIEIICCLQMHTWKKRDGVLRLNKVQAYCVQNKQQPVETNVFHNFGLKRFLCNSDFCLSYSTLQTLSTNPPKSLAWGKFWMQITTNEFLFFCNVTTHLVYNAFILKL